MAKEHGISTDAGTLDRLARSRPLPLWLEPYIRLLREKPLAVIGGVILLVMVLAAVSADVVAPYSPIDQRRADRLTAPGTPYLLGSDQFGRDVLSRIIYGARTSLYVGLSVMLLGTTFATLFGGLSGYFGGKLDVVFQRVVDAFMSVPSLILLLTIVSVIGPGLINIILALAFRQSISESRIVRSAVISIKENQYLDAARAIGCTDARILLKYILPNVTAPIIILATVSLGQAILAEASLSFLGLGVPPPTPTWGGMLSAEGRQYMIIAPWIAIFPGVALSLAVFGINMLGDGLRDVLDPRLRGARGR